MGRLNRCKGRTVVKFSTHLLGEGGIVSEVSAMGIRRLRSINKHLLDNQLWENGLSNHLCEMNSHEIIFDGLHDDLLCNDLLRHDQLWIDLCGRTSVGRIVNCRSNSSRIAQWNE